MPKIHCEYPFPENYLAYLVRSWNDAVAIAMDEDDMETVHDSIAEACDAMDEQIETTLQNLSKTYDMIETDDGMHPEIMTQLWSCMRDISNLIRCYAAENDVRGELYGLNLLISDMVGEGNE